MHNINYTRENNYKTEWIIVRKQEITDSRAAGKIILLFL